MLLEVVYFPASPSARRFGTVPKFCRMRAVEYHLLHSIFSLLAPWCQKQLCRWQGGELAITAGFSHKLIVCFLRQLRRLYYMMYVSPQPLACFIGFCSKIPSGDTLCPLI